jgi:hypothetical protein
VQIIYFGNQLLRLHINVGYIFLLLLPLGLQLVQAFLEFAIFTITSIPATIKIFKPPAY